MVWVLEADTEGVILFEDTTANDSDKTLDLAALALPRPLRYLTLTTVRVKMATTATLGTRTLNVELQDSGGDVLWQMYLDAFDMEDDETQNINLAADAIRAAATLEARDALPRLPMRPDWRFRVWDSAAVDAAADDLQVLIVAQAVWG